MAAAKKPKKKPGVKPPAAVAAPKAKASKTSLKTTIVDTPPRKTHKDKKAAIAPPSGPVFRGLRTVIYKANDLALAKAFYIALTGKAPYFDQPFYVGFDVGGFELGLDPDTARVTAGHSGAVAYWRVDRIGPSWEHAVGQGAIPIEAPRDVGGGIQTAIVEDPSGNLFGLIEMP